MTTRNARWTGSATPAPPGWWCSLGKDGSIIDDGHGRKPVAALRVEAVDATGAGDCFAGSLLARRCKGDSWEDAVRYANVAAALSTLGYGAVEPLPSAEQVQAKL